MADIEKFKSIEKFDKKYAELCTKNHDRILSKSCVSHKKMDDLAKKLETLEENLNLYTENIGESNRQTRHPLESPSEGDDYVETTCDSNRWNTIGRRGNVNIPTPANSQRQLIPRHKTAPQMTPAKSCVVVKGLGLHVSEELLFQHLQSHGIATEGIVLLTTYDEAKSYAYKITIKTYDLEKIKSVSIWPQTVTVQHFKEKNRSLNSRSNITEHKRKQGILKTSNYDALNTKRNVANGPNDKLSVQFANDRNEWLRKQPSPEN